MSYLLGRNATFLVAAGAGVALGSLVNVGRAEDVTYDGDTDIDTFVVKEDNGWKIQAPIAKQLEGSATIVYKASDAQFAVLEDSFLNGTTITIALMTMGAADSGSEGLRFNSVVKSLGHRQPSGGVVRFEISFVATSVPVKETVA